jgi:hypothetical protein
MLLYFTEAFYIWDVKIFSTLFLFAALVAMLYINIGQMGGLYIGISDAKVEAAGRLGSERLSILTISGADLSSGRASFNAKNELIYNGKLYDIASRINEGGNITLKVLHDEKEEGLLSDLKEVVEGWFSGSQRDTKQPSLKQVVIIKDFMPACKFTFNHNSTMKVLPLGNYLCSAETPLLAVLKSPPQFV